MPMALVAVEPASEFGAQASFGRGIGRVHHLFGQDGDFRAASLTASGEFDGELDNARLLFARERISSMTFSAVISTRYHPDVLPKKERNNIQHRSHTKCLQVFKA
jgi:hypothetical protein